MEPAKRTDDKQAASEPPDRLQSEQAEQVGLSSPQQTQLPLLSEGEGVKLLPLQTQELSGLQRTSERLFTSKESHPTK